MAIVDLRYARALDEVVMAQQLPREAVKTQLSDFLAAFETSPQLREVFGNPSIPEDEKLRLLDALAQRLTLSRTVRNFLAVMIHNVRLEKLRQTVIAYLERADSDTGVTEAEIISAHPLDAAGKQSLEQSILQLAGSTAVRATYREDSSLLGGAVIRLGSTVYDGSVRGQLEQMKRQMVAAV